MSMAARAERMGNSVGKRTDTSPAPERRTVNLTSAQRAAVIVALLGEGVAKPIAEKMDDAALAKVVSALEGISFLSRDDVIEVVIDFLRQLRGANGALMGGPTRARQVLSGIVDPMRMNTLFGETAGAGADFGGGDGGWPQMDWGSIEQESESGADGDTWLKLSQRDPRKIAEYLDRLSPNLIAMILRRLDASVASSVLCYVNEEKLGPTLGKMVESPKTDPGIESVLCRMVEMEFLNLPDETAAADDGHLEVIGEMLSLIPNDKRENLVGFLRTQYESKLPIIQRGLFTIEGLPDILPRVAVPVVFKEVDQDLLLKVLASLKDGYGPVLEYLLGNISARMADQLREDLKRAPAVPDAEAEDIHREFLTRLMDLRRRGMITINKPGNG